MRFVGGQRWPRTRRSMAKRGGAARYGPPRLVPAVLGDWAKIRDGHQEQFVQAGWAFAPAAGGLKLAPILQTNPTSGARVADLAADPWRAAATASADLAANGGRLVARLSALKIGAGLAGVVPGASIALFATAAHAGAYVRIFGAEVSLGFGSAVLDTATLPAALGNHRLELRWMRSLVDNALVFRARAWPASDPAPTDADPWQVTAAVDAAAVDLLPATAVVVANAGDSADFTVSNKFGMEATLEYTWADVGLEALDGPAVHKPLTIAGAPLTVNGAQLTAEVDE